MKTPYTLLLAGLLSGNTQVFSKGHPPIIYAAHNSTSVLYYTPGTYLVNGLTAVYPTDTLAFEMPAGDTCTIGTSGASGYPVISFMIYRNDSLILSKGAGGEHNVFLPGKYRVVSDNGFTLYPVISVTFYIHSQATPVGEVVSSVMLPILYPNPCINTFCIKAGSRDLNGILNVVDMNGKLVWNESTFNLQAGSQHTISTAQWQPGMYFLQVFNGSEIQRFRIVKN